MSEVEKLHESKTKYRELFLARECCEKVRNAFGIPLAHVSTKMCCRDHEIKDFGLLFVP